LRDMRKRYPDADAASPGGSAKKAPAPKPAPATPAKPTAKNAVPEKAAANVPAKPNPAASPLPPKPPAGAPLQPDKQPTGSITRMLEGSGR
jgi:hypothetical protein